MTHPDALKSAFRDPFNPTQMRRQMRADRTRAQALSPVRILLSLLLMPVVALGLTVSIYVRTSPYEPQDALRHLITLTGCPAAAKLGMANMALGEVGYHARNDVDGDGVSCEDNRFTTVAHSGETMPFDPTQRARGAKFLRP